MDIVGDFVADFGGHSVVNIPLKFDMNLVGDFVGDFEGDFVGDFEEYFDLNFVVDIAESYLNLKKSFVENY